MTLCRHTQIELSIVSMFNIIYMPYLICFQVISIKDAYKSFDLENVGQGQIQGNQNESSIRLPISVQ